MERRQLLSTYVVTNTSDNGSAHSLRWAILQVNADTTPDTIQFNIPANGPQTIPLTSALPVISQSVLIDGTSEPGYQGTPLIVIDGSKAGSGANGLVFSANENTVTGLAVVGFSGSAIVLNSTSSSNVVQGNYLGVNALGTSASPNGEGISIIGSSGNTIGGGSSALANVISGNSGNGIEVESSGSNAGGNWILGNLIGTTADGLHPLGNVQSGILIAGASGNQIGAFGIGLGNVISGNLGSGIKLTNGASENVIQNNTIGVGTDGETPLGNGGDGILLNDAPGTLVGGSNQGDGNIIGCNHNNGINISNGTNALVSGNFIGTDPNALFQLGNVNNGVNLASSLNTIGGTQSGSGNVIDFNGAGSTGSGVQLVGNVNQNAILSNSIYQNGGLGINLGSGPTPNHPPGSSGPNNYQNYPVLTLAESDGSSSTVQGTLTEAPNTLYLVQLFVSPTASQTGFGQGKTYLGATQVTTNATGTATFTATVPTGTSAGNYVSATATDPAGNTSEFALDVVTQGEINLVASGTVAPTSVLAGGLVTYTLNVANQGILDAHKVALSDQLPSGVTVVSVSLSQGYVIPGPPNGQIVANLGTVPAGTSASETIVVQTGGTSVGTITDTGTVTSQETDPSPSNETISLSSTVLAAADVSVALSASPNPVLAGADVTFVMTVSNLGPDTANAVIATLPMGSGFTDVSATSNIGTVTYSGGQVGFTLDSLSVNGQALVTVVAQALTAGNLSETATVSSQAQDPNLANNTATANIQVNPASDLAVGITASSSPVTPGIGFSYNVTITNNGPSQGNGIVVTDTMPAGVTFVSATSDQNVQPTQSNGVVTLTLSTLNMGAAANLTINVIPTTAPGSTLTDSASVASEQADPNLSNNSATLLTPVVGTSDLAISAVASSNTVDAGQDLTYTITVSNLGPDNEPDGVVTSQLPADVQYVSASTSTGGAPSVTEGGLLTVSLGPLNSGQSAVVTLVVTIQALTTQTVTTPFAVDGQNVDLVPSNNTALVSVSVDPSADLAITINAPASAYPTVPSTWTLTVSNLGPSDATDVTVLATLPSNASFITATSNQGQTPVDLAGMLSAELGEIDPNHSATITLVLQPTTPAGSIVLPASVSGDEFDANLSNNQTSVTVAIVPAASLALSLSPMAQTDLSGHPLTFNASLTNTGPSAATNVVLNFPMAPGLTFVQCLPSQGSSLSSSGQLTMNIGALNPGASANVSVVVIPSAPGTLTQSATVTSSQYQLNPTSASATASATVLESAGVFQFSSGAYADPETAGVAQIPVDRIDGSLGAVTVSYQTIAVNATPGLDFTPVSGTLSFAAGQTSATIQVPVLADPWDNHDEFVNVVLQNPTSGAMLGSISTASLRIVDVDPDFTPPEIAQLSWTGNAQVITSITLTFTEPLNPTFAGNPGNYRLINFGNGNRPIPFSAPMYNAAAHTVTLSPASPLGDGQFYQIQVLGNGPTGVRDLAGNLLDGAGNGTTGTNYVASFAQGNKLQYVDNAGNQVTLKLTGPGYLEQIRDASGEGESLTLMDAVAGHTTLSGTIHKTKGKSGRTNLGIIQGLGTFGAVRVKLPSPPFYVRQFPFMKRGRGVL